MKFWRLIMTNIKHLQPIILCGGFGARLWPLSKKSSPKQFIKIFKDKSLFELTLDKLKHLKNSRDPIIITSEKYRYKIEGILLERKTKAKLILEPFSKNTGAAIFFSSYFAKKNDDLLILPSDHFIENTNEFVKIINFTLCHIQNNKWIVFGVPPTKPSDSYGHIKFDNQNIIYQKNKNKIFKVLKFIEKPNIDLATSYFETKNYLFNSGIFLVNREKVLSSIRQRAFDLYTSCNEVIKTIDLNFTQNTLKLSCEQFNNIPSISIDYAVLEKESEILCSLFNTHWNDVGSWDSFFNIVNNDNRDQKNLSTLNSQNEVLTSRNRMIATVGVEDLLIVDTQDTTLITKKNNSQGLKKLVETLIKSKSRYVENIFYEERPWGSFEILFDSQFCKVKKITILPNRRISLQYHMRRSEHWFVVSGRAKIYLDGLIFNLNEGKSIDIKKGSKHYVKNQQKKDLVIIEIQIGDYFGEDDIIRLDDPYNRI